jgi:hypothetical protein
MRMHPIKMFSPSEVLGSGEAGPADLSPYKNKFLVQGDSWFSFGSLFPPATGNLLMPLELRDSACGVNCARPGKVLVHMVDARRDPQFVNLLLGAQEMPWDGILLSGGGNDLIDAIGTPPVDSHGHAVDPGLRLLLTPAERGNVTTPAGYVSEAGWRTFDTHIVAQFHEFVAMRDDPRSKSRGVPIFVHTYDIVTPRDSGAGLGFGPWLSPALVRYGVPAVDWDGLSRHFLQRLAALMTGLALAALHVVQTQGTCIPAADGSVGSSNDWENEIHPNPGGYRKLAQVYGTGIDQVMP